MSNQHPVIPPKELVYDWHCSFECPDGANAQANYLCAKAAQWGADQELEACVNYIDNNMSGNKAREFRAIRRPKPPSLKEQALALVEQHEEGWRPSPKDWDTIRRALEALPND